MMSMIDSIQQQTINTYHPRGEVCHNSISHDAEFVNLLTLIMVSFDTKICRWKSLPLNGTIACCIRSGCSVSSQCTHID